MSVLGRYPALAGVDLDVADGEVVLLTGPNGAGKTTLLRLLAGLAPLTSGTGSVLGHSLGGSSHDRRGLRARVALLGHETFCYDDLTARENLRFHARAIGRDATAAEHALEAVGLGRSANVAHRLLSAGQRRRLALGVVVARHADLLLLDEPHAGLDASGREILEGIVRGAAARGGAVVMASHELERARPLVDREVAMSGGHADGALAGDGTALDADGPGAHHEPGASEGRDARPEVAIP